MKIQEEGEKLLLFQMFEVHKLIAYKSNKIFSQDGVDIQIEQVPVLMIPYYMGILSQQEIADRVLRDKSSILRTVSSLTQMGLIVVAADPFDKRRKLVQLTKEGKALAAKIAGELHKVDQQVFECLSDIELVSFRKILVKLASNLSSE